MLLLIGVLHEPQAHRRVTKDEAEQVAKEMNCVYFECHLYGTCNNDQSNVNYSRNKALQHLLSSLSGNPSSAPATVVTFNKSLSKSTPSFLSFAGASLGTPKKGNNSSSDLFRTGDGADSHSRTLFSSGNAGVEVSLHKSGVLEELYGAHCKEEKTRIAMAEQNNFVVAVSIPRQKQQLQKQYQERQQLQRMASSGDNKKQKETEKLSFFSRFLKTGKKQVNPLYGSTTDFDVDAHITVGNNNQRQTKSKKKHNAYLLRSYRDDEEGTGCSMCSVQ